MDYGKFKGYKPPGGRKSGPKVNSVAEAWRRHEESAAASETPLSKMPRVAPPRADSGSPSSAGSHESHMPL